MLDNNYNWNRNGTFEYRDKDNNLMIIDRYFRPFAKEVSFDINIFENENDEAFFSEINVVPKRLKKIIGFYEFDDVTIKDLLT